MPLNFDKFRVFISGTTTRFLVESIDFNESNSLTPIYSLGYKGVLSTSPNDGLKNSVSLNYLVEAGNDINFNLVKNLRNYNTNSFPVTLNLGTVTHLGYLDNYSLDILPHDIIKGSVSYIMFSEPNGVYTNTINPLAGDFYNLQNGSGLAHYHSTYAKTNDGAQTGNIVQANYSFKANWQPIYKIGQSTPVEVKFIGGEENFNFTSEYPQRINVTGQSFNEKFTNFDILEINPLSDTWGIPGNKITLYPSSGKIISNRINISEDNLILQETSVIKYY